MSLLLYIASRLFHLQLIRQRSQVSAVDKQYKQMTADIAHDLRTPLAVVSGYIQALKKGKLKPTAERFEVLHNEVQLLQNMVEDLRFLALADSGDLRLALQKNNC